MILVGNQRGGSKDLALHLLKDENERVEVHEIRGFASRSLLGAFQESYSISRATRCKQHLYSLSLSPPMDADVPNEKFEDAIDRAERQLGLTGQPRAIVFHEKRSDDGSLRRHAHAVWCRIDTSEMKARQLSFTHKKLQSLARELYIEHEWEMPRGLLENGYCDPCNFTLAEWQQAKRRGKDPKHLKALFQDAWTLSDDQRSFANALLERGFILARGDRRGFVAVDHNGEAYSVSRWVGIKAKKVRAKLGGHQQFPSVQDAHRIAADLVIDRLEQIQRTEHEAIRRKVADAKAVKQSLLQAARERQWDLRQTHRIERTDLEALQSGRLRNGLLGLLDFLSGRRKRIAEQRRLEREELRRRQEALTKELQRVTSDEIATINHIAERNEAASRTLADEIARDITRLRDNFKTQNQSAYIKIGQSRRHQCRRARPKR